MIRSDPTFRAIRVRGERKRNPVAPSSAHLGGEQLRVDHVLVRLEKILEAGHVRPDHLEHGKAAVVPQFCGFWHEVIKSIFPQDEQPGVAWLLVIGPVAPPDRRELSSC